MANLYEKLLEAWTSAEDKETKFQQLLESWIKAVDAKNTYRQLLNHWVDTDEHIRKTFYLVLGDWLKAEDNPPYDAIITDMKDSETEGDEYFRILKDWSVYEDIPKICPTKQWFEEWVESEKNKKEVE